MSRFRITHNLDALVAPTNSPAWPTDLINGDAFLFGSSGFAAVAGYPLVSVTAVTFMASAWSEPKLIRIASGFEAAADVWQVPRFLPTFAPKEGDRARPKPTPTFATSALQTHAAKLDQFLVPKLRRLNYL